jgi:hypothetical protein
MSNSSSPTLLSVTATGNNTITLHFSEAMEAGSGNLIISGGHSQTYMTKDGLATRIVGASDTRPVAASDSQVSYSGSDVIITLGTALKQGLTYSVTMGNNVLRTAADDTGFHGVTSTSQFFFTTTATPHSAPTATVDAAIHFTDSGASSSDYVTSWDSQTVTGTYTGTLGASDFVQVSLDNGASWHKASISGNSWSYGGTLDWTNLGNGNQDSTFSSKILARVSNTYTLNSGTVSQAYTYDHQSPSAPSGDSVALSSDSGSSASDHITNVASQTISGTIAGLSGTANTVQISMSNGDTWQDATVSGNNWNAAVTLNQLGKVLVRVVDLAGNASASAASYYDYTTGVSLNGHALTLLSDFDTGTSHTDQLTKSLSHVTLAVAGVTGLNIGDRIELVDTNHGSAVVGYYTIQSTDLDGYGVLGVTTGKMHNGGGDIQFQNITPDSLADGLHVLAARITDVAGNVSSDLSDTLSVTIDTSVASMASVTPQLAHTSTDDTGNSSTDNLTNNAAPTVSAQLSAVAGLVEGDIIKLLDGGTVVGSHTITASELDGTGHISAASTDIALSSSLNGDGAHSLTLRVDDAAGNTGIVSSTPLVVTLDRDAPTIVSSTPGQATPASLTDLVMVFGEQVYISSGAFVTLHSDAQTPDVDIPISASNLTVNGTTLTIHLPGTLDASTHYTVTMSGTIGDAAGNYSVYGDIHLFDFTTDDPTPAVPPHIEPAATTAFSGTDTSFSGSFYSEGSGNDVQVSFDGTIWHNATKTPGSTNHYDWSYSGSTTTHDLRVRLVDNAGAAQTYLDQGVSDYGNTVLHFGSSGDDTINVSGANAIVYSGLGSDTITVGDSAHVTTAGGYTTVLAGSDATVYAGGIQSGVVVGSHATVELAGSGSTVQATGDNLLLTVDNGGSHSIVLDSLNVRGITAGNGSETLNLTFSNTPFTLDSLHTTHAMTGIDLINMMGSQNTITVDNSTDVSGLGVNTLYITGNLANTVTINASHWSKDVSPTGGYDVYHAIDNSAVTLLVGVNMGVTQ